MAQLLISMGTLLNFLGSFWIALIFLDVILRWLSMKKKEKGMVMVWLANTAAPPVNLVRRTVPTVYRDMDFAPWLTMFFIVLMKTFIFRAVIYWGMLHKPPVG